MNTQMTKRDIIKERHDVTIRIEKELSVSCRHCPFFNRTHMDTNNDCIGCKSFDTLNGYGEELTRLTRMYREANGKTKNGFLHALEGEFVQSSKFTARERLENEFSEKVLRESHARGITVAQLALKWGVSHSLLINYIREQGLSHIISRKTWVNNTFEFIDNNIGWEKYKKYVLEGFSHKEICEKYELTNTFFAKWLKKEKDARGIKEKLGKLNISKY